MFNFYKIRTQILILPSVVVLLLISIFTAYTYQVQYEIHVNKMVAVARAGGSSIKNLSVRSIAGGNYANVQDDQALAQYASLDSKLIGHTLSIDFKKTIPRNSGFSIAILKIASDGFQFDHQSGYQTDQGLGYKIVTYRQRKSKNADHDQQCVVSISMGSLKTVSMSSS